MNNQQVSYRFGGKVFTAEEVSLIREVVATCGGLSRKELANTISELVGWTRPSGGLKEPESLVVQEPPPAGNRGGSPCRFCQLIDVPGLRAPATAAKTEVTLSSVNPQKRDTWIWPASRSWP